MPPSRGRVVLLETMAQRGSVALPARDRSTRETLKHPGPPSPLVTATATTVAAVIVVATPVPPTDGWWGSRRSRVLCSPSMTPKRESIFLGMTFPYSSGGGSMMSRWTSTLKVRPLRPRDGAWPSDITVEPSVSVSQVTFGMSDGSYVQAQRQSALESSRRRDLAQRNQRCKLSRPSSWRCFCSRCALGSPPGRCGCRCRCGRPRSVPTPELRYDGAGAQT
jgi:hypothetical protein